MTNILIDFNFYNGKKKFSYQLADYVRGVVLLISFDQKEEIVRELCNPP